MAEYRETILGHEYYGPHMHDISRRISWGAIFAGAVVALVIELTLVMLGIGVGLGVVNPATEQNPLGGLGLGASLWVGISGLISLFCGGWVAARFAGYPKKLNGVLHGISVWGIVVLFSLFLMTTTLGALISGAAGIVGKGITVLGTSVAAQTQTGSTVETLKKEGQKVIGGGGATVTPQERQRLLGTTQQVMGDMSTAAIWTFVWMVLGGILAAIGGSLGAPKEAMPIPSAVAPTGETKLREAA